jgi:hypothetical protein
MRSQVLKVVVIQVTVAGGIRMRVGILVGGRTLVPVCVEADTLGCVILVCLIGCVVHVCVVVWVVSVCGGGNLGMVLLPGMVSLLFHLVGKEGMA